MGSSPQQDPKGGGWPEEKTLPCLGEELSVLCSLSPKSWHGASPLMSLLGLPLALGPPSLCPVSGLQLWGLEVLIAIAT